MTKSELSLSIVCKYLDINNLVKPKLTDTDSSNGVLYSSILQILMERSCLSDSIQRCFKEPGLLMRTPKGDGGNEQFDDLLGVAIADIVTEDNTNSKAIFWYGLKHFFVYNTDGKLQATDWLGRFPFVWMFMFASAFPMLKWLVYAPLLLYVVTFNPNSLADSSGLQLQWLQCVGFNKLYNTNIESSWYKKFNKNTGSKLSDIFSTYYNPDHPFTLFVESNLD